MICKMCGQDRPLIKAHIIPEAFFRELRNGGQAPQMVTNKPGVFPRRAPIGVYDQTILCLDCENAFSVCDSYGAEVLISRFDELFKPIVHDRKIGAYVAAGIDQVLLHRFFAGVLWRASVTSHPFFSNIRLGPYELTAKRVFLEQEPEKAHIFAIVLSKWTASEKNENLTTSMMNPFRERWGGVNAYRVYFGEITAYIKVDKRSYVEPVKSFEIGARSDLFVMTRHLDDSKELGSVRVE